MGGQSWPPAQMTLAQANQVRIALASAVADYLAQESSMTSNTDDLRIGEAIAGQLISHGWVTDSPREPNENEQE